MISVQSNIKEVLDGLAEKFISLTNTDPILREVATSMQAVVRDRVHGQGKDASGGQIGDYSSSYLKFRQNGFKHSTVIRGPKKGESRPVMNYNRISDSKIILSLSRQMENDFSVLPTEGGYGLGWNNPENADKAGWNEERYGREIFKLTDDERRISMEIASDYVNRIINA